MTASTAQPFSGLFLKKQYYRKNRFKIRMKSKNKFFQNSREKKQKNWK